jgi:nitrogen fixation protein NifQ
LIVSACPQAIDASESVMRALHARLIEQANDEDKVENAELFARMIASRSIARGALPRDLGLGRLRFEQLCAAVFPGTELPTLPGQAGADPERASEVDDLRTLLIDGRAGLDDSELWMADIVAAGCLGSDHLWQDLGLWSRADLSALMQRNFPALAARNDRDMKWKKFLYKQLCGTQGIYVCRAPSCEVCHDYAQCFGPED